MATKVSDPIDKYVGSRVRMRRLMLGMSQGALADQLGLTFQQVQKYEKGTNRISAGRLQAMCHILQVPVPFFFDGAPQSGGRVGKGVGAPSLAYVSDLLANADGFKLVRAFRQISNVKLRRSLVRLVEEIGGEERTVNAGMVAWCTDVPSGGTCTCTIRVKFTSRILEDLAPGGGWLSGGLDEDGAGAGGGVAGVVGRDVVDGA